MTDQISKAIWPVALLTLLLATPIASIGARGKTAWTDAGTKNGVALSFRDDQALAAREVRATANLPFPARLIFAAVCDLTQYRSIVPGVQEVQLLSGQVPAKYEVYLRYSPRFVVVAARDVALHVQSRAVEGDALGCQWSELTDRIPARNGTVRMTLLRGSWAIEPRDATSSRVVYQVAANPGGRLPGWLVRRGAVNALPEVIEQVKRCLERAASRRQAEPASCSD